MYEPLIMKVCTCVHVIKIIYLLLGNMFSSCRGHMFDWSLSSTGEQEADDIIR